MNPDVEMNLNFNESDEEIRRDQLKLFLEEYKLSQYYETFINEGFDRLLSVSLSYKLSLFSAKNSLLLFF